MVKTINEVEVQSTRLGRLFVEAFTRVYPDAPATQRQWNAFQRKEGAVWNAFKKEAGHNRRLRERYWEATGTAL